MPQRRRRAGLVTASAIDEILGEGDRGRLVIGRGERLGPVANRPAALGKHHLDQVVDPFVAADRFLVRPLV